MMRRCDSRYILMLSLLLFILTPFTVLAAVGDVWLQPATTTKLINDTFVVQVHVNAGTADLSAFDFLVSFDQTLVNVDAAKATDTGLITGTIFSDAATANHGWHITPNLNNTAGTLRINGITACRNAADAICAADPICSQNPICVTPSNDMAILTINFKTLAKLGSADIPINVRNLADPDGNTIGAATPRVGVSSNIAVAAPTINVNPTSLSYINVADGSSSAKTVTISNTGTAPLTVKGISAPAAPFSFSGNCVKTLDPNTNCPLSVTFAPTTTVGSPFSSTINITSDDTTNPSVAVSMIGTSIAVPRITVDPAAPASLDFSNVVENTTSAAKTLTVTNSGDATLSISGISSPAAPFSISSNSCGATLAASANCKINVVFAPASLGNATGSIVITSNAFNASSVTVNLNGTGIPPGVPLTLVQNWNLFGWIGNEGFYAGATTPPAGDYASCATLTQKAVGDALTGIGLLPANYLVVVGPSGKVYVPNSPFNTLNNLLPGMAYWIFMNADGAVTLPGIMPQASCGVTMLLGWVQTGFWGTEGDTPVNAFKCITGKYDVIVNGKGLVYVPGSPFNTLKAVSQKEGYFIHVTTAGTLQYSCP